MSDSNIGKKLDGRYELLELIGVGGMADIYKARDITDNKIVAAKILKNEFAGSEDFLRRFRNESKAIALLSHTNIVKIVDVGFTDKVQFIVMEYIDGITLTEFIEQQGALKWRDAVHFTTQILRALQHAHDRGIVHRDIKSQNVMLLPDGTIKVMDFGIARFNRETDKTMSEKAIGSVHYISPEQARGEITDEKSDIYSVGVMLYEMLTGKKPFDGDNPVSIALMHMQVEPKKMNEINNSIPEGLIEITTKAMQKEAGKRYQTAGEMIKDIEEFKKNPSIVFEYKYFSASGDVKYFEKDGDDTKKNPKSGKNPLSGLMSRRNNEKDRDIDDEEEFDDDFDDYDDYYDDEIIERRSPLLPILFAVATVVVIMTAWLIYIIVTQNLGTISEAAGEDISMPWLIDLNYDEAGRLWPELRLNPTQEYSSEYDKGVIMWQSVPEGRVIKSNHEIEVKVSKGPKLIPLDDYGNGLRHIDDVVIALKKQGFPEPRKKYKESETIPANYVIETDPPAGSMLSEGTTITVWVSQGMYGVLTNVPDFLNLKEQAARDSADMYDVVVVIDYIPSDEDKKGRVVSQSIPKMTQVEKFTVVQLEVGTGLPDVKKATIDLTINSDCTGDFIFKYYIDGVLQDEKTETRNIALSKRVFWEFENSDVHTYAVEFTSVETGKSGFYCIFEYDFSGEEIVRNQIHRNPNIFRELLKTDDAVEETTVETTAETGPPGETEPVINNDAEDTVAEDETEPLDEE